MADVWVRLFFLFDKDSCVFSTGIAVWIVARYCRVKFSCSFLLLCCNRTDTFLVTEFFLTTTIVMEVSFCFVFRVCNSIE